MQLPFDLALKSCTAMDGWGNRVCFFPQLSKRKILLESCQEELELMGGGVPGTGFFENA